MSKTHLSGAAGASPSTMVTTIKQESPQNISTTSLSSLTSSTSSSSTLKSSLLNPMSTFIKKEPFEGSLSPLVRTSSATIASRVLPNIVPNASSKDTKPSDSAELQHVLSSKVKENEKLRLIIDKLRSEISILKILQGTNAPDSQNDDTVTADNNDLNGSILQDTINPMKLSTNIDYLESSSILGELGLLLDAKQEKPKEKPKKKKEPKKVKKEIEENAIFDLSIFGDNDVDDGVLDEKFSSSSPSPSLSLSLSNTSEITNDIDVDSILLMNSINSLSPVPTNSSRYPNHHEPVFHDVLKKSSVSESAPVSNFLNHHHKDSNSFKQILQSSVKLERSTSLNSYNINNDSDHYYNQAVKLKHASKKIKSKKQPRHKKSPLSSVSATNQKVNPLLNEVLQHSMDQTLNLDSMESSTELDGILGTSLHSLETASSHPHNNIEVESSDELSSLKLERSLSLPMYTFEEPKKDAQDPKTVSTSKPFEPCGFCVDGAPCLCIEAKEDSDSQPESKIKIEVEE